TPPGRPAHAFSYTSRDEVAAYIPPLVGPGSDQVSYSYDADRRPLRTELPNGQALLFGYDTAGRLSLLGIPSGATSFTHTPNGERATRTAGGQTTTYQYDTLGNLANVRLPSGTQIDYVVDGRWRRIGKRLNGTLVQGFLYSDALRPVAELDGAGNVVSV